jgi:type IV pilus assembly protein PilM
MITILRDGQLALQRNVNYGIDMAVEAVRAYPVFGTGLDFESALETLCNRRCIRASMEFLPDVYEKEDTDDFVREARREVTESLRYLVGNISRIMDYYISRNSGAEFASICLCGLGGEVLGLEELLTEEIGQKVLTLTKMEGCDLPKSDKNRELAAYLAAFGALKSKVSLQEKTTKKQKETKESLSGAVLIFCAGAIAAVALSVTSIGLRQIREQEQEHLYERIEEEKSVEEIYTAYNTAKAQYSSFQSMYQYTSNPNEGLVEFIEEMEEKMPSNITVETFSSTGTQVSFSMRLASKSEAANMLMQLRTFESLGTISTSGISEAQDGTVTMSVTCSYSNPAPIESGLE